MFKFSSIKDTSHANLVHHEANSGRAQYYSRAPNQATMVNNIVGGKTGYIQIQYIIIHIIHYIFATRNICFS